MTTRSLFYAGVGSRATPDEILGLMVRLGTTFCNLGWGLSSGAAEGADQAFWTGAVLSPRFLEVRNRIYLPWNNINGHIHDPAIGYYDATRFTDTYDQAKAMALEARGSFEGLGRGGIALHTRNVFQIHGHTLQEPVRGLVYWGIPVGKGEKVKGGTNTALQIAIRAQIPHRINLYTDEGRQRAETFLYRHNQSKNME